VEPLPPRRRRLTAEAARDRPLTARLKEKSSGEAMKERVKVESNAAAAAAAGTVCPPPHSRYQLYV
jgi:hypothetical protein